MSNENQLPERIDMIRLFQNPSDFLQKLEDLPEDRIMAIMFIGEDCSALSDVALRFACIADHEKAKAMMDFYVIHLERQHEIASCLGVREAPYFTWFQNGQLVATLDGDSEEDLARMTACFTHGNGVESIKEEFAGRQLDHNPLKANLDADWLDIESSDEEHEDLIEEEEHEEADSDEEDEEANAEDDEHTDEEKRTSFSSPSSIHHSKLKTAVECQPSHILQQPA